MCSVPKSDFFSGYKGNTCMYIIIKKWPESTSLGLIENVQISNRCCIDYCNFFLIDTGFYLMCGQCMDGQIGITDSDQQQPYRDHGVYLLFGDVDYNCRAFGHGHRQFDWCSICTRYEVQLKLISFRQTVHRKGLGAA